MKPDPDDPTGQHLLPTLELVTPDISDVELGRCPAVEFRLAPHHRGGYWGAKRGHKLVQVDALTLLRSLPDGCIVGPVQRAAVACRCNAGRREPPPQTRAEEATPTRVHPGAISYPPIVTTKALAPLCCAALLSVACTDDSAGRDSAGDFWTLTGDGDGDGDGDPTGDGDGDPTGDGDGDPTGDGDGDGDGDTGPVCGDGVVEGDEGCDDGNPSDTDECTNACTEAVCGDGIVHEGVEMCDDGNDLDDDGCDSNCMAGSCGDGELQGDETCDDGNDDNTDECAGCQPATCGDSYVQAGVEECDDGNDLDADACTTACLDAVCGDGFLYEGVEECDDANELDTDACVQGCLDAVCGDGFVHEGVEVCDGMGCNDTCDAFDLSPYCVDILGLDPNAPNGDYMIDPDGPGGNDPYAVYCDMAAGGHTVWAVTHDWGEWGSNMNIVIRDRLVPGLGSQPDWSSTCQLFNTTNYVGGWKNSGQTYTAQQYQTWGDAQAYWQDFATQMFPSLTYNDILILQDSNTPGCWAHYAEAGCMTAFGSPNGPGYAFCRNGAAAAKRYHIYLCL